MNKKKAEIIFFFLINILPNLLVICFGFSFYSWIMYIFRDKIPPLGIILILFSFYVMFIGFNGREGSTILQKLDVHIYKLQKELRDLKK